MTDSSSAVFLSYASQDAEAARHICDALRGAGIEVWFDQSELTGGDAWDRQITKQIHDCALFVAVISMNTDSRDEGYFRREWRVAVDRTRDLADDKAFLLPVVVDGTADATARVPDKFREVQWSRLPAGATPPAFVERVSRLLSTGQTQAPAHARQAAGSAPASVKGALIAAASRPTGFSPLVIAAVAAVGVAYFAVDKFVLSKRIATPTAASMAPAPPAPSAIPERSIAVLPFVDMSERHDQEYFSDGLAEELLDLLGKTPGLHVIARTSSFSFKGKADDIPTIAQKLHVENILEGSVRKAGNRLRVTTQLIQARSGEHIWSETYDRELKDVFKVQDEIAGAVVLALRLRLAPDQTSAHARGTANTEAYIEYLLGRRFYHLASVSNSARAVAAYRRAIQLDPNYGRAYAGLSEALAYIADHSDDTSGRAEAVEAAETAIRLDPASADGYVARADLLVDLKHQWNAAEADFKKAIEIDATAGDAQSDYGYVLVYLGHEQEGLAALRRATILDPLSPLAWNSLATALLDVGDSAGARAAALRAIEINPEYASAQMNVGEIQLLEGATDVALATFRQIVGPGGFRAVGSAMAEHTLGHSSESQKALDELLAHDADHGAYQIAEVFAWRGETDQAFEWLERAYRQNDGGLIAIKYDRLLVSIRKDPRFRAFLRKMNLPE